MKTISAKNSSLSEKFTLFPIHFNPKLLPQQHYSVLERQIQSKLPSYSISTPPERFFEAVLNEFLAKNSPCELLNGNPVIVPRERPQYRQLGLVDPDVSSP